MESIGVADDEGGDVVREPTTSSAVQCDMAAQNGCFNSGIQYGNNGLGSHVSILRIAFAIYNFTC